MHKPDTVAHRGEQKASLRALNIHRNRREAHYKNNGERLKPRMEDWDLTGVEVERFHVYCKPSLGSNFIELFVSPMLLYVWLMSPN